MNTRNIYAIFTSVEKEFTNQIIETTKPQVVTVIIFAFYFFLWFDFNFDWSQNNKHSRNKLLVFTIIFLVLQ